MLDEILDNYYDQSFMVADGFDEAVIGVEISDMRLVYSVKKCLEVLERDMSAEDAYEYFTYNVSGAYVGDKTPVWCWDDLF